MTTATIVYEDDLDGHQIVECNDHSIQFGGPGGDGYCYAHQSFACLGDLTDDERQAIRVAGMEP